VNATGIDRSTLADMILRMEERGLLTRGRSADDGRAKSVALTASGRSALATSAPRARQADDAILGALPRGKRAPFLEILRTLADAADEPAPEMKRPAPKARKATRSAKKTRKTSAPKRAMRR
jgi:DNA-binding MarR family transcriptional regulator